MLKRLLAFYTQLFWEVGINNGGWFLVISLGYFSFIFDKTAKRLTGKHLWYFAWNRD